MIISVYAPTHLDPMDSYGLIACELVRYLNRRGTLTNAISLGNHRHPNQDEELKGYTSRNLIPSSGGILLGYPTGYHRYGSLVDYGPKIAFTMFESSRIPPEWVPILNKCDEIIVPSSFCYNSFLECGVKVPINIIPLGIQEFYTASRRPSRIPFTFLTFLDRGKRKGGLLAQQAFTNEFGDDPSVRLIIKHREETKYKKLDFTNKNIDVIYKDMDGFEINELFNSCHCLINPNKGEGFGLIPREFSATGGISIATYWGGTAEAISLWGYPIECEEEPADWKGNTILEGLPLGVWAKPILKDLQDQMRHMYENRDLYMERSYQKASRVKIIYNWDRVVSEVLEVWKRVADGMGIRSKKVTT